MADDLHAEAYDATDQSAENNARRDELRRQRLDAQVVNRILRDKNGRDWLYRKLVKCHIYGTSFEPGQPDTTAFKLGQENIGKQLMLEAINAAPDAYMLMLAEQKAEAERLDQVRRDEEKKRSGDDDAAIRTQGFEITPPVGWPGGPSEAPKPKGRDER